MLGMITEAAWESFHYRLYDGKVQFLLRFETKSEAGNEYLHTFSLWPEDLTWPSKDLRPKDLQAFIDKFEPCLKTSQNLKRDLTGQLSLTPEEREKLKSALRTISLWSAILEATRNKLHDLKNDKGD